jgi:Flp pilus assembly pilin Flp
MLPGWLNGLPNGRLLDQELGLALKVDPPLTDEEPQMPTLLSHADFAHLSWPDLGQGTVEYALIVTLVVIIALTALAFLGGSVTTTLSNVAGSV